MLARTATIGGHERLIAGVIELLDLFLVVCFHIVSLPIVGWRHQFLLWFHPSFLKSADHLPVTFPQNGKCVSSR